MNDGNKRTCFFCNGFYGSTDGEYVCATCHSFLYLDLPNGDNRIKNGSDSENDSGNDEPSDVAGSVPTNVEQTRRSDDIGTPHFHTTPACVRRTVGSHRTSLATTTGSDRDYFSHLPNEVLPSIFMYMDSYSLVTLSMTSCHFQLLIATGFQESRWENDVRRFWPLFKPLYRDSWFRIFIKLVLSSPCRSCLQDMIDDIEGNRKKISFTDEINDTDRAWKIRRLRQDIDVFRSDPPEGVNATPLEENGLTWFAEIHGPTSSPYEGGVFYLYVVVPSNYPLTPPHIRFITRIFHPNISRHGDIGLDSISHNWTLTLTIGKVLLSIQSMLMDPYCKVCMEPSIARLYQENIKEFNRIASKWTHKYAMSDVLPFSISELVSIDDEIYNKYPHKTHADEGDM